MCLPCVATATAMYTVIEMSEDLSLQELLMKIQVGCMLQRDSAPVHAYI